MAGPTRRAPDRWPVVGARSQGHPTAPNATRSAAWCTGVAKADEPAVAVEQVVDGAAHRDDPVQRIVVEEGPGGAVGQDQPGGREAVATGVAGTSDRQARRCCRHGQRRAHRAAAPIAGAVPAEQHVEVGYRLAAPPQPPTDQLTTRPVPSDRPTDRPIVGRVVPGDESDGRLDQLGRLDRHGSASVAREPAVVVGPRSWRTIDQRSASGRGTTSCRRIPVPAQRGADRLERRDLRRVARPGQAASRAAGSPRGDGRADRVDADLARPVGAARAGIVEPFAAPLTSMSVTIWALPVRSDPEFDQIWADQSSTSSL